MIITIQDTGRTLDLPADAKLSIEISSPIFATSGSMSLPISLPLTKNNRLALNFPDRLDISDSANECFRSIPDITVIVTQGIWQQLATMNVSGCSETAIEVTLYFNESNIWSKLEGVTVPQAMAGLHFGTIPPADTYNLDTYRQTVISQFKNHMVPNKYGTELLAWLKENDFIVAHVNTKDGWLNEPACVKRYVTGSTGNGVLHEELIGTQYDSENELYFWRLKAEYPWYTTSDLKGKTTPTYYTGAERIVGYLNKNRYLYTTGFLRLDVVLRQIFNYLGYDLEYDFSTYWPYQTLNNQSSLELMWHQIVVLNNTMDAIYPGCMYYSVLVPEVSAKEFVSAVQAQFGVVFTTQPNNKTVKMQFSEKILRLYSQVKSLAIISSKQIAFNSSVDYKPADNIDKIKGPEYDWNAVCDSIKDASLVDSGLMPEDVEDLVVGQCYSFVMDGVCQRTTTTSQAGSDKTKNTECPLAFGVCTQPYSTNIKIMGPERYDNCILIDYTQLWSRNSPEMEEYDQLPVNTSEYGLFAELNTEYNIVTENIDNVIIATVLSIAEISIFDFTTPYVIQGRLCWPLKLKYELQNAPKQQVTIEFIAPKNV